MTAPSVIFCSGAIVLALFLGFLSRQIGSDDPDETPMPTAVTPDEVEKQFGQSVYASWHSRPHINPEVPVERFTLNRSHTHPALHDPDQQMRDSIEYGSSLHSFRVLEFLFGKGRK